MSLLSLLLESRSSVALSEDRYWTDLVGSKSDAGVTVSARSALTCASVWQAVNLLSNKVAGLDLLLYRRTANDGREPDTMHTAYRLMRRAPSQLMSKGVFVRTMMHHVLLWGNAYAHIGRDRVGRPIELIPLDPDRTYPVRKDGVLWYVTEVGGEQHKLVPGDVLHLMGLSRTGLMGLSVVAAAAQSIGLSMGLDKYAAKFFANGARASGVLSYPGKLKDTTAQHLQETFDSMHQGLDKAHRTILLDGGARYQQTTVPPDEAQMLGSRELQIRVVASIFGLPPHKLGDPNRTSYASLEQENKSFLDDSLDPWLRVWEEEANLKLLTDKEKQADSHYFEFTREGLLRADLAARYAAWSIGITNGFVVRNTVCRAENLPLVPGGDKVMIPANMVLLDENGNPEPPPAPLKDELQQSPSNDSEQDAAEAERQSRLLEAQRVVLRDAVGRMVRRAALNAREAAKKPNGFLDRVEEFLPKQESVFADAVNPSLLLARACAKPGQFVPSAETLARQHVERCRLALLDVAGKSTVDSLAENVDQVVRDWESEVDGIADQVIGVST